MHLLVTKSEHLAVQRYEIPPTHAGQRLDQALSSLSNLSRSRIKSLLQEGGIQNTASTPCKASSVVHTHEIYQITLPATRSLNLEPEAIDLDILFEDEHLLVVNKPAGMVVHPSHGHDHGTLVHALLHHCPDLPGINGVERPGIVHRIDKDTSGSLVVAKTEDTHHALVALFATHDIQREYIAWCRGIPTWTQQHIDKPIARHPQHRQKMAVVDGGKRAITDAQLEQRILGRFSRIRLTLHTGRTHQIRVHLASEGVPILADETYARRLSIAKDTPKTIQTALQQLQRQALHAEVLGFIHPITHAPIHCVAPLPDDLAQLNRAFQECI